MAKETFVLSLVIENISTLLYFIYVIVIAFLRCFAAIARKSKVQSVSGLVIK